MAIVCKFGGTSVGDLDGQARLATIVESRLADAPLVVVSALGGVSDALIEIVDLATRGEDAASSERLAAVASRHRDLLARISCDEPERERVAAELDRDLAALESQRHGIVLLGDAGPWVRARFVGSGEILSSRLVALVLGGRGVETKWLDAREVIRTAGRDPEKDPPDPGRIGALAGSVLAPLLGPGRAVVTQGFIGRDREKERPTLLGRGGSDYTASLLGRAVGATRIEIWTDVDGVLTASPGLVPDARRVRLLSFDEASELAYFGAKVLHPSTLLPAVESSIPVWVGNARRPEGDGTTIVARAIPPPDDRWIVKAIAAKPGLTLVSVTSTRMLMAHGFLARIFKVFDDHGTAVDLVATSEVSVSLTVDDDSRLEAIVAELEGFSRVEIERDLAVVCLVGEGMRGKVGLAADVFRAVRPANVRLITQGASAINLSLVVPETETGDVVRRLHEAFFRGPLPSSVFGESFREIEDLEGGQATGVFDPGALVDLARRYGTPLYVYDLDAVEERAQRLLRDLPGNPARVFFACKANANPRVLEHLARCGVGVEAASPGEVERALACGHEPGSVVLSSSNAHPEEILGVMDRGCAVTLGSRSDVQRIAGRASGSRILIRVNPGVGDGHHPHVVTGGAHSKFGVPLADLERVLDEAASSGLRVVGLHAHIGSGIVDPGPLLAVAERLLGIVAGRDGLTVLDLGGGFGIPYRDAERELDTAALGAGLDERFRAFAGSHGRYPEVWYEPGRYLVGPAGCLVAQVTCRKESEGLTFIGLDTGMNHLLRPALYGAYHRIVNLSAPEAVIEWVEVVGNICETTDIFASNRPVPRAEEGHYLAILDCGAYGFSMASRYNLWPLPKEIVLRGGSEV